MPYLRQRRFHGSLVDLDQPRGGARPAAARHRRDLGPAERAGGAAQGIRRSRRLDPKAPLAQRAALLRGRVIAVDATGSLVNGYLLLLLKRAGIDPDTMQIPTMQPANMLAAFQTKQIDGFAMPPPWPLVPVTQGDAVLSGQRAERRPGGSLPVREQRHRDASRDLPAAPSALRRCRAKFVEAEAFINDHPAEALAVVKKRFATLDDKVLVAAFDAIRRIVPTRRW